MEKRQEDVAAVVAERVEKTSLSEVSSEYFTGAMDMTLNVSTAALTGPWQMDAPSLVAAAEVPNNIITFALTEPP